MYCFYYALEHPSEFSTTQKAFRKRNENTKTYLDANKLLNVRRNIINKRLTDAETIMIEDSFKAARNEKVNPKADNTETELEGNETFCSFDSEDEAADLKDCKGIVENIVGNERTKNEYVNEYQNEKN